MRSKGLHLMREGSATRANTAREPRQAAGANSLATSLTYEEEHARRLLQDLLLQTPQALQERGGTQEARKQNALHVKTAA